MPTTFTVFQLGTRPDIDPTEGNTTSENAASLVGSVFGGPGNPIFNTAATLTRVGTPTTYSMSANNTQFRINGGTARTYDGTATYNATLTYTNGTTATITAVIVQDTAGRLYLFPESAVNADQTALQANAIRSIRLDSVFQNTGLSGTATDRAAFNFVTCFVRGTLIETAAGPRAIEDLATGDLVLTLDHGPQSLRWIGSRRIEATDRFAPVLIRKGALGNDADVRVSPQHRVLMTGWRAELYAGDSEVLVPAHRLVNGTTILRDPQPEVEYVHMLFDRHELVTAAGLVSESFHPGMTGWSTLDGAARAEILALFPSLAAFGLDAYGALARPSVGGRTARLLAA
jgi:hypothetical protein